MYRRPVLIINNAKGKNILPSLNGRWISVKTTENDGKESDSAEITCIGGVSRSFATRHRAGRKARLRRTCRIPGRVFGCRCPTFPIWPR